MFNPSTQGESYEDYEYLNLWVPDQYALVKMFKDISILKCISRDSVTDFKFNNKKFKFMKAQDGQVYAKTKETMQTMDDFIEKYKDFEYDGFTSRSMNPESMSYSQMVIENAEYHDF